MLVPKLVLTPLLVATTSLAGRRWGPALSGWLVALPLTSGPIVLFIALESGPEVAGEAAGGALFGAVAQVAFAVVYTLVSGRTGWAISLLAASVAFFGVGFAAPPLPPLVTYALLVAGALAFLAASAGQPARATRPVQLPRWDIPARVAVATILVVAISALAPIIGGRASGILATFPVYAAVLTTFAHMTTGRAAAVGVLRGLASGLVGFGAFFLALGPLLDVVGIGAGFVIALAIGLAVHAVMLVALLDGVPRSGPAVPG